MWSPDGPSWEREISCLKEGRNGGKSYEGRSCQEVCQGGKSQQRERGQEVKKIAVVYMRASSEDVGTGGSQPRKRIISEKEGMMKGENIAGKLGESEGDLRLAG